MIDSLIEKVNSRDACIGVVGLGYVGLPIVIEFAKVGFEVLGLDIDARKTDALNAGDVEVIVALAVIAGTRAGDTVTAEDFENLEFGAIGIEADEERPTEDAAAELVATTSDQPGTPAS